MALERLQLMPFSDGDSVSGAKDHTATRVESDVGRATS